ncbi:MAG: hypothetical protein LLG04_16470 [Parachlamydia sp.]|nr:hypothetical protein [Parachlamydia sp.]
MGQPLLGDSAYPRELFPDVDTIIGDFRTTDFLALSPRKRFRKINETLGSLIQSAPHESFLLAAVVDYLQRVDDLKILTETYNFAHFEFWLNHLSGLSEEEEALWRGKIAGKYLPREEYQRIFPIGMGMVLPGTHFVTAHLSPDVDTTIASFWGWVDAVAAKVGSGQHLWMLPGGPPESPIMQIIRDLFGKGVFAKLSQIGPALTLTAMDLVTQSNFIKESGSTSISALDHGVNEKAVILVDENGHYCGDWRSTDVEPVRQVIILFKSCVRWFENNFHVQLISLFSKPSPHVSDLPPFVAAVFDVRLSDCEPVREFDAKQRSDLNTFFTHVLGLPKGIESTFTDLGEALSRQGLDALIGFRQELEAMQASDLFQSGKLLEDRPSIFNRIQRIFRRLDKDIHRVRDYVERLDIAIQIKNMVLSKLLHYVTLRSDVEDIRIKMNHYNYLTVVIPDENGRLFPIGVVWAHELRKSILGTVTMRDFCNLEEVKMASYLSVVSVIDHHKSNLKTLSPPLALIGDAQSCNVLLAEQALAINDRYSLGGMSPEAIEAGLVECDKEQPTSESLRRKQKLMQKHMASVTRGNYYVHPSREKQEYLSFLHAILDDTDLLTKVSHRDVICVAALLNHLKSLTMGKEVTTIQLDDIPKDQNFAKNAAKRILQNEEMYSLYRKVYASKEAEAADNLLACVEGRSSTIFQDTKEQNGCCRIGQTKLFASNYPLFRQHRVHIEKLWRKTSESVTLSHPELDLHMHMISTIASAREVYEGRGGEYAHQDELWFWIPNTELAQRHLASFLSAFQAAKEVAQNEITLELPGEEAEAMAEIFLRNFPPVPVTRGQEKGGPLAILHYRAGSINSRKAMISPYLPRQV